MRVVGRMFACVVFGGVLICDVDGGLWWCDGINGTVGLVSARAIVAASRPYASLKSKSSRRGLCVVSEA
jgi:hypothetical protein